MDVASYRARYKFGVKWGPYKWSYGPLFTTRMGTLCTDDKTVDINWILKSPFLPFAQSRNDVENGPSSLDIQLG